MKQDITRIDNKPLHPLRKTASQTRRLRARALAAVLGRVPFDLVIRGAKLVNVLTREIYPADIGLVGDLIAAVEPAGILRNRSHPGGISGSSTRIIEASGSYAVPGLIDAHMHIESSFLLPPAFARAVLPHGTTTVAADPHEIANVLGLEGVKLMLELSRGLPLSIFFLAPTGVPAAPGLETSGAAFGPREIRQLLSLPRVLGLAEVMDFRAVVEGQARMAAILAEGLRRGSLIEGHCPLLTGSELQAYLVSGIDSDHNDITPGKVREKLRLGMTVEIQRKAVSAELIATLREYPGADFLLVTDDVAADELWEKGHLNYLLREAVSLGLDPIEALQAATVRPARRLRLFDRGVIAPGRRADVLLLRDLTVFQPSLVVAGGQVVFVQPGQAGGSEGPDRPSGRPGRENGPTETYQLSPVQATPSVSLNHPSCLSVQVSDPGPASPSSALSESGLDTAFILSNWSAPGTSVRDSTSSVVPGAAWLRAGDLAIRVPIPPLTGSRRVRVVKVNPDNTRTEEIQMDLPTERRVPIPSDLPVGQTGGLPGGVTERKEPSGASPSSQEDQSVFLRWEDSSLALLAVIDGYDHLRKSPGRGGPPNPKGDLSSLTFTKVAFSETLPESSLEAAVIVQGVAVPGQVPEKNHPQIQPAPGLVLGLVAGTGLSRGAVATTYAHDSHHLLILGQDPSDMALAANTLRAVGGGMAAVLGGRVTALIPLPVAGLMSSESVEVVGPALAHFRQAMLDLGYQHKNPIMSLATLTLPVSPSLKLTNLGLVDVGKRRLVSLFL